MKNHFAIVLIGLFLVAIAVGYLLPSLSGSSENGRRHRTLCMGRVRSLATAMRQYAEVNDEMLPMADWSRAIGQYASPSQFHCSGQNASGEKWGYALNAALAGRRVSEFQNPSKRALLFETEDRRPSVVVSPTNQLNVRHGNGSVYGFLDGSVRFRTVKSTWYVESDQR